MADESTTTETVEPEPVVGQETVTEPPVETPAEGELPEAVKKILQENRKELRDAVKRAKQAEARAKEYEDRDKSEQDKLAERAAQAEKDAADARQQYLRLKVSTAKGLSAELAERLNGESEEELEQDAERLLEIVKPKPVTGSLDGGARRPPSNAARSPEAAHNEFLGELLGPKNI